MKIEISRARVKAHPGAQAGCFRSGHGTGARLPRHYSISSPASAISEPDPGLLLEQPLNLMVPATVFVCYGLNSRLKLGVHWIRIIEHLDDVP